MFPYRRGKKRPKGGPPGRRGNDHRGPRRMGGVGYDLLNLMPSTTKALAQMLAGNTRASGQLAHARNILAQAERAIEERHVDRMFPADREEFLELLARLKLTLADADALHEAADQVPAAEVEAKPRAAVPPDRLRELALSLAGELAAGAQRKAEAQAALGPETAPVAERPAAPDASPPAAEPAHGAAHKHPQLRLKRRVDLADAER